AVSPPVADAARAAIAAVPTMAVPPNAAAIVSAHAAPQRGHASGSLDPAASGSSFKPWDSRPVELGDDEDWLR
ncbi:MAG: hypothetical protein ACRDHP_20510, partial [Ktedonobacterales bacterium]